MLASFPAIAFQTPLPASAWRGDTGFRHADQTTAAEVVAYEQRQGRLLDLAPELVAILAAVHASALLWVTFKRSLAARYGPPARVPLDGPAYVIGEDGEGGFLILFPDNSTGSQTEDATMKAPAEATARELKEAGAWYAANMNAPEPPAEVGGYVVIERSIQGDGAKLAGNYPDRQDAITHARLYPATEERARESGQAAWAEVHAVTKGFYEGIGNDPAQGERFASVAALYSHAREIEGGAIIPASQNEAEPTKERQAMNDTPDERRAAFMKELEGDRKADLAKRIDALQQDAEAIVTERGGSAAGHYQQHRENFDAQQGELEKRINHYSRDAELNEIAFPHETAKIADSKTQAATLATEQTAQGHEYAAFLAERVGEYKQSVGQEDTAAALFKEAGERKDIAVMLRGGPEPEPPTDPTKPTGRAEADGAALDHTEGGKYDALRASEADARALSQERELAASKGETVAADPAPVQARAPEPEAEDETKKARGGGDSGPTRPELGYNIRPEVGVGPGGLETYTTAQSERIDPQKPEAEPRPQHPDAHQAPEATPSERLAAELKELDAAPDERQAAREITTRDDAEASAKRQDAERRADAGESRPEDAAAAPSREQTAGERLAAELKELDAEPTPSGHDAGRDAASVGRGMM